MGKIKVQHVPARSAKIHDHDLSQTADTHVQQILYKTTTQNREMEMQDVGYELVYEPGKDAADHLDYLSRHPLPETGKDDTEKTINLIVSNEHGVVMISTKEATSSDPVLQDILK